MTTVIDGSREGPTAGQPQTQFQRSLIIPVYRNEKNVPDLIATLVALSAEVGPSFETVFVIDGSPDASGALIANAAKTLPFPTQIAFHSRNFGSFTAIRTGLELARGEHIAVMAADLQEPPELISRFFKVLLADEADIVFGQRTGRDDPLLRKALSNSFWGLYRKFIIPDLPVGGVDVFACNRRVREELLRIEEPNSSLVAQLFWVGFRRAFLPYRRQARKHGLSAWNLSSRLRYMMDSVFGFTDAPIQMVLWLGIIGSALSLALGVLTAVAQVTGYIVEPGYATMIITLLFFGSANLTVQGILGCYIGERLRIRRGAP